MRNFLRTILRILDGSPSVHMATRNRQRGQSMLELAFITPLLAILIAGASEVGWYTNRWLTLLEVTRVGARSATFLQNGLSAPEWDNDASIIPAIQTEIFGMSDTESSVLLATNARDCDTGSNFGFYSFIVCLMQDSLQPLELNIDTVDPIDADDEAKETLEGSYIIHPDNQAVLDDPNNTSDPKNKHPDYDASKDIKPEDYIEYDDIVISVFAIQNVNHAKYNGLVANNEGYSGGRPAYETFQPSPEIIDPVSSVYKVTFNLDDYTVSGNDYPPGRQNIVIGRYPSNANECSYRGTYKGDIVRIAYGEAGYEKDPFDYLDADDGSSTGVATTSQPYNTSGGPVAYTLEMTDDEGNGLADDVPEAQRGFALTGQHRVDDPVLFCYGSEFTVREVEELINMPGFIEPDLYNPPSTDKFSSEYLDWQDRVYASQDRRDFFEPQGLTLVEIFWEHQLLLDFPMFRPLQQAYGEDEIVIALWSAFPLPSVAPNITYQLP